jgi:hypothetical protein
MTSDRHGAIHGKFASVMFAMTLGMNSRIQTRVLEPLGIVVDHAGAAPLWMWAAPPPGQGGGR